MANPFKGGGKVKYTPGKVKSKLVDRPPDKSSRPEEEKIKQGAAERDKLAADLLAIDRDMDILDGIIADQCKDMAIPGGAAAQSLCDSDTISYDCYLKAKELLRAAPMIAAGYDPVSATNGTEITKRAGTVLNNCKDFDPDTFHNQKYDDGTDALDSSNKPQNTETESLEDIQQRANENQKKWALLVLFWDLLWGKPKIETKDNSGEELNVTDEEKQKAYAFGSLPDVIKLGRPNKRSQLLWASRGGGTISDARSMSSLGTAYKIEDWHLVPMNKGIPAIKGGFLLSILVGVLGIAPQVLKPIFNLHEIIKKKFGQVIGIVKKIPAVGKKVHKKIVNGVMAVLDINVFAPFALVNNIFIEGAVWLAMMPKGSKQKDGSFDIPDNKSDAQAEESGIYNASVIQPTPAGWVPLDCIQSAQEVVNRVHKDAEI